MSTGKKATVISQSDICQYTYTKFRNKKIIFGLRPDLNSRTQIYTKYFGFPRFFFFLFFFSFFLFTEEIFPSSVHLMMMGQKSNK